MKLFNKARDAYKKHFGTGPIDQRTEEQMRNSVIAMGAAGAGGYTGLGFTAGTLFDDADDLYEEYIYDLERGYKGEFEDWLLEQGDVDQGDYDAHRALKRR